MSTTPFFLVSIPLVFFKRRGESPWCFNDPPFKQTHGFSSELPDNYNTILSCPVLKLTYKAINIHFIMGPDGEEEAALSDALPKIGFRTLNTKVYNGPLCAGFLTGRIMKAVAV